PASARRAEADWTGCRHLNPSSGLLCRSSPSFRTPTPRRVEAAAFAGLGGEGSVLLPLTRHRRQCSAPDDPALIVPDGVIRQQQVMSIGTSLGDQGGYDVVGAGLRIRQPFDGAEDGAVDRNTVYRPDLATGDSAPGNGTRRRECYVPTVTNDCDCVRCQVDKPFVYSSFCVMHIVSVSLHGGESLPCALEQPGLQEAQLFEDDELGVAELGGAEL